MDIHLGTHKCSFRPWRPSDGQVFNSPYAIDIETTLIDETPPGSVPDYVMGAACDGNQGFFISRDRLRAFLDANTSQRLVFHNAPFDLKVMQRLLQAQEPGYDVYKLVDQDQVYDTLLLNRLYKLGANGDATRRDSGLGACSDLYLGCSLPKDVHDSKGNDVRLSWAQYLHTDPRDIDPVYLEYLGKDVLATILLYRELMKRLDELLHDSTDVWGFVSDEWLEEQARRWGPQTHHIQIKAAIVLDQMTALGIGIDIATGTARSAELAEVSNEKAAALRRKGYVPGKGSDTVLQEAVRAALKNNPGLEVPRTGTGKYSIAEDALAALADFDPFFQDLASYKTATKLRKTYLEKMNDDRIYPSYDVLKNTGRTSSFGAINIQNLPRDNPKDPQNDPRIRRCFVPAPGHVFYDCDYKTIEMATLAQSVMGQLGVPSKMAEAINEGKDLHRLVAGQATGKKPEEVTSEERQAAKAVNFGLPGGLGVKTLQAYAADTYKVQLTEAEAEAWRQNWLNTFPEMQTFLNGGQLDTNWWIADFFDLTWADYHAAIGNVWSCTDPAYYEPNPILGGMLVKALSCDDPMTNNGRFYTPEALDYFWSKATARIDDLQWPKLRKLVEKRRPCFQLGKLMKYHFGQAPVFTLTGRLRAGATFCARHNTMFQGLAADGAKLALWELWRAGYRIAAFVHDQMLIEVPIDGDLDAVAQDIRSKMIGGMKMVVPEVAVDVEGDFKVRWTKSKEDEFDPSKHDAEHNDSLVNTVLDAA
jgi:hypothetical protein